MGRFRVFDVGSGSDDNIKRLNSMSGGSAGGGNEDKRSNGPKVSAGERTRSFSKVLPPADNFHIPSKDIVFLNMIGRGSFGAVFRGKVWGQEVALKKLHHDLDLNSEDFIREVQIMCATRHPNIVEFLGFCNEPGNRCIITELCSNDNLESLLIEKEKKQERLPLPEVLRLAQHIARGLNWLHHKAIIHRDLKPSNIFLDSHGNCRIGDFGLAYAKRDVDSPKHEFYGVCGTLCYIAPEIMRREHYGVKSDVFSFAMILCELASGRYPFNQKPYNSANQIQESLVHGFRPPIPDDINPKLAQLIRDAWNDVPTLRPSMDEITERLNDMEKELPPTETSSQEALALEVLSLKKSLEQAKLLARSSMEKLSEEKARGQNNNNNGNNNNPSGSPPTEKLKKSVHNLLPKKERDLNAPKKESKVTGRPSFYNATT